MEEELIIALLTISVVILTAVVVTLLIIAIVIVAKVRRIITHVDRITKNVASASDWVVPSHLFSEAVRLFSKKRKDKNYE